MPKETPELRQSGAVAPSGVGAILDVLAESFVVLDLESWTNRNYRAKGEVLVADRLLAELRRTGVHVAALHAPVAVGDTGVRAASGIVLRGLPVQRFPAWLFCPDRGCRRMYRWTPDKEVPDEVPVCPSCQEQRRRRALTPMRFVVVCADGHLQDVPWDRWAHASAKDPSACRSRNNLRFRTRPGRGGGFDSLIVKCEDCGASESLSGISGMNALARAGWTCPGGQPWESAGNPCAADTHVVQRGAGNVYFPVSVSGLTIPPESRANRKSGGSLRDLVANHPESSYLDNEAIRDHFAQGIASRFGVTVAEVLAAHAPPVQDTSIPNLTLAEEEWASLSVVPDDQQPEDLFLSHSVALARPGETAPDYLRSLGDRLGTLVGVDRLREVRTMTGFHRYEVREGSEGMIPTDLGRDAGWLPATEVFGEGVFLTLDEERLQQWEQDPGVEARVARLAGARSASRAGARLPQATPRFVLLHTLSHVLIRRLAYESGYSSASIRERIYASDPGAAVRQAGILLYTSAGDAEGTLGGLVRQAEPPRLAQLMLASLFDAATCSFDPVCRESGGQGIDALNLAACHGCTLLPETSCTAMNCLLDRVLLTGDDGVPGFFSEPFRMAVAAAADHTSDR